MINVDFDTFNPQIHPWFHLHFGEKLKEGIQGAYKFEGSLKKLAEGVRDLKKDIFSAAEAIKHEIQLSEAAKVFEAKPGILGLVLRSGYS
ncbi:MAG: hypothetical protein AABN33_06600 [Acidobacteriota bacterium]